MSAWKNLVEPKPGYDAAKARALARLEHGYNLDWVPSVSRDELHDRGVVGGILTKDRADRS